MSLFLSPNISMARIAARGFHRHVIIKSSLKEGTSRTATGTISRTNCATHGKQNAAQGRRKLIQAIFMAFVTIAEAFRPAATGNRVSPEKVLRRILAPSLRLTDGVESQATALLP